VAKARTSRKSVKTEIEKKIGMKKTISVKTAHAKKVVAKKAAKKVTKKAAKKAAKKR